MWRIPQQDECRLLSHTRQSLIQDVRLKKMKAPVIRLDPKERMVGLSADRHYSDRPIFINLPTYWCPSCDDITAFTLGIRDWPDFNQDHRRLFDKAMGELKPYEEDYCDLTCRICGRPVRVVYGNHEFAMASYVYFPLYVLEIEEETNQLLHRTQ